MRPHTHSAEVIKELLTGQPNGHLSVLLVVSVFVNYLLHPSLKSLGFSFQLF